MKRGCSRGGSKIYETRVAGKKDKAARFLRSRGVGGRKSSFVAAALSVIKKKRKKVVSAEQEADWNIVTPELSKSTFSIWVHSRARISQTMAVQARIPNNSISRHRTPVRDARL